MEIVHLITTADRGGAENQLLVLAKEQIKSGYSVTIIYLKGAGELNHDFQTLGCLVLSEFANLNPIFQLVKLSRFFRNKHLLIHCHLPRAEILGAIVKQRNVLILSRHNAEAFYPGAPKFLSSFISRRVVNRANAVIAISQAVKSFLISNREFPKSKSPVVVYYGFEKNKMKPTLHITRSKLNMSEEDFVVSTIARIVDQKDYPTLLAAFEKFLIEIPRAKLLILGDGILRNEMEILASKLGISASIHWIGRVDNVKEYLDTSDVFVLTSKYEGFGLVLLEAINSELPIVASRISAIPEVLGDTYPYLVEQGNPGAFADALLQIYQNENISQINDYLQSRLRKFDSAEMSNRISEIYKIAKYE